MNRDSAMNELGHWIRSLMRKDETAPGRCDPADGRDPLYWMVGRDYAAALLTIERGCMGGKPLHDWLLAVGAEPLIQSLNDHIPCEAHALERGGMKLVIVAIRDTRGHWEIRHELTALDSPEPGGAPGAVRERFETHYKSGRG